MSNDIDSLKEAAQVYRYGLRNDLYDHPRIPERLRQLVGTAIAALKDVSEFEECYQQAADPSTANYVASAEASLDLDSQAAPVSPTPCFFNPPETHQFSTEHRRYVRTGN